MGIIGDLFGSGKMFLPQACGFGFTLTFANLSALQVIKSARVMKKAKWPEIESAVHPRLARRLADEARNLWKC